MTDDDFFVGYLPTPPATSRRLGRVVAALLLATIGISWWITLSQRDPGAGRWSSAEMVAEMGTITSLPHPVLHTVDGRSLLLVGDGKHAADVADLSPATAVTGSLLERDGWTMLELQSAARKSAGNNPSAVKSLTTSPAERFVGEIVDAKCYLGAMKPGDGKPHKGCAALCLRGGIPPLLRTIGEDGQPRLYLIVGPDQSAIAPDDLIPFVGDAIELRASVVQSTSIPTIQLVNGSIRRR